MPVVVRDVPADRCAQVAKNQKRQGLTPLELARFIRAQVDAGDSNATIARQLGMNLTAVAHHLSLLDLPPVLDVALTSGRCTSPRRLRELSKLHADMPDQVRALLAGEADVTRASVFPSVLRLTSPCQTSPPWPHPTGRLPKQLLPALGRGARWVASSRPMRTRLRRPK